MAYSLVQLQAYFKNANAGVDPTAAQNQILLSYVNQNSTSLITDAQALQSTIDLASDTTTAVGVQTYQFFLGFAPSAEGLASLNKAYTGVGAQANLNGENRYIAQSVALALQNTTAKSAFSAAYGALSIADATTTAYNVIVGSAAASAAGINIANAVAFLTSASSIAYYTAFVKANVPGLAAADVDLAVKAALVGEIIYQATIFNNGAGVGSYATVTNNLIKDLTDDGVLTFNNVAGIDLFGSYGVKQTPQTLILTDKADALNGGSGDDIFIGTNTTVSAADILQGGSGVDALTYSSSGAAAVVQSGFKSAGIEVFQITSDAVQGTTFDVSGSTDVNSLINDNSSSDLTLVGLNAVTAVTVRNTSAPVAGLGASGTVNTTIQYTAAAVAGATTTQALALENVYNPTVGVSGVGSDKTTVTANGVEIFNVTGAGATGSHLTALVSSTLNTVNIDGAQNVRIDGLTFAQNASGNIVGLVDGSKSTGGINVTLTNSGGVNNAEVTVKGGIAADRADFSAGFDAKDSFDGGAGTDTLVLAVGLANGTIATPAGTVTNVEILEVSGGGTGTIDLAKFAGIQQVVFTTPTGSLTGASLAGNTRVDGFGGTSTVTLDAGTNVPGLDLRTSTASNTTNDTITLNVNKVGAGDQLGAIALTGVENINVNVADDAGVPGVGALTVTSLGGTATKNVVLAGNTDLTITGAVGGAALTSFDASAVTGKLTLTAGITTANAGATVKLGASDDVVRINASGTGTKGDTITLGAGKDTIIYTGLAQSGDSTTDTITDFKQGEDRLDLTGLVGGAGTGILANAQFLGTRASFGLAQGALSTAIDGLQAVFQADTSTLWVDLDSNGQLDANDFRIILSGVTDLKAGDLGLALTGNTITLSAAAATVNTTAVPVNADNKTTADNDTIKSTIPFLAGSTIDGGLGANDTLQLTSAGTAAIAATVTNVETLVLADGTNTVSFAAGGAFKNITGGTGNDAVNATNVVAGGAIDLGTGADALSGVTKAFVETTGATISGGGSGIGTVALVDVDTLTLTGLGAAGTDTLNLSKVSNFETVDLGSVGASNLTVGTPIVGPTPAVDGLGSGIATLTSSGAGTKTIYTTAAKADALTTVNNTGGASVINFIAPTSGTLSFDMSGMTITGTTFATASTINVTVDDNTKAGLVTASGTADTLTIAADFGGAVLVAGTTNFEKAVINTAQTGALTFNAAVTDITSSVGSSVIFGATATATKYTNSGATAQTVTAGATAQALTYDLNSSALTTVATGSTGVDTFLAKNGALTVTNAGTGDDVVTATGTGIVNFTGGAGNDTISLNAGNGVIDQIHFNDGAGTKGIVAAANGDTVSGFVGLDQIWLDTLATTAPTAGGNASVQVVAAAGATVLSNAADVAVFNYELAGAVNVLAGVLDGTALVSNTGALTVAVAGDEGYLVAYDAGNAYLYYYNSGADTNVTAGEIALIGTFNGVTVGSLNAANFQLGA